MSNPPRRIILVTGPSGAGLSTALHALEDAGFEAIDNLPLRLVPTLLGDDGVTGPLALTLDSRNRHFSVEALMDLLRSLQEDPRCMPELLFLDCTVDELIRRYSATRRRHPMDTGAALPDAITREIELLAPLRQSADVLIDTAAMTVHELRADIQHWFAPSDGTAQPRLVIHSFSYRRGLPRNADIVLDCRFLSNPHWDRDLRALTGRDEAVRRYIRRDPRYAAFFEKTEDLLHFLLPAAANEGKSYFSVAFGCTGGRHRSVCLAEEMAKALADRGWQVSVSHVELTRPSTIPTASPEASA